LGNLIEGIHQEMNRARELAKLYDDIGPAGAFGNAIIEDTIKRAEKAIESGEAVDMVKIYAELKELK
jgi:hypothetical protein